MKPVIFGSPRWEGRRLPSFSRVIGAPRVIPKGGAVLGIMPPYSVLLLPVVPMNGLTWPTFDREAVSGRAAAAARSVMPSGGMSAASRAMRTRTVRAGGVGRVRIRCDNKACALDRAGPVVPCMRSPRKCVRRGMTTLPSLKAPILLVVETRRKRREGGFPKGETPVDGELNRLAPRGR